MTMIRQMGQAALLVEVVSQGAAHRLREAVLAAALSGVEEVVVGARTVLVRFHPDHLGPLSRGALGELATLLESIGPVGGGEGGGGGGGVLEVPVAYDGPDLAEVADTLGLSVEEVVRRHLEPTYTVGFVGFAPGFAYLTGLDPILVLPRREVPRTRVPAGSVGIAGEHTGVYPQATPGGWLLLGSTSLVAFDVGKQPPSPFVPGGKVRFVPGSKAVVDISDRGESPPEPAGEGSLLVIRSGPLTTVQDRGRFGWAHLGVPRAGAVDLPSLTQANELVGNDPGAACLEVTVLGPELRAETAAVIALTGGTVDATVDDHALPMGGPIAVPAGSTLSVGAVRAGVRTYVGIAGGIAVTPVLGSRSTDTLSGLGPAPLRDGDRIRLGRGSTTAVPQSSASSHVPARSPLTIRVVLGPRVDWFTPDSVTSFLGSEWQVTPACNRTGAKLAGRPLARADPRAELLPEPIVAGAVQVPPNGQPIVLLANHPTTGGYPVIAVVIEADLALIAQAQPGERVVFRAVRGLGPPRAP